jgi:ubiquitin-protein ligase
LIWFLSDLARLAREREAIDELQASATAWLKNVSWKLTPLLEADADIDVNGELYPVTLKYPYVFPASPPSVFPRGVSVRWSYHQYGRGGELCLEWGADNWHTDITGADMLDSAHKLLSLEDPSSHAQAEIEVPSRDAPTFAQQLRRMNRFVATPALIARLDSLPFQQATRCSVCISGVRRSMAAVTKIEAEGEPIWNDKQVPSGALDGLVYGGTAIRMPSNTPDLPLNGDMADLSEGLARLGIDFGALPHRSAGSFFLLLHTEGKTPNLIWLHKDSFSNFATVHFRTDTGVRLTDKHAGLSERSAYIAGCGSMGSKIATSLARAGVGRFVLVDDDVFLPENLVRHDLDWRSVGTHKVDALSYRLRLASPGVSVAKHRVRLSGQESNTSIAAALRAATECDVIIDATASANVFNLLSSIAVRDGKPMVWAEVFGGGIGGMMARFSPGETPTPAKMRVIVNHWCSLQGVPWAGREHGYETRDDADAVLIADDADVSVIAAHTARYSLDVLFDAETRVYSHPVYLIGLKHDWLFKEPFDTIPIDVGPPEKVIPAMVLSPEQVDENAAFLADLINGMASATSDSE